MAMLLIAALVVLALVAAIVAVASGARRHNRTGPAVDARSVRRFFQYALLYALGILAALGVQGLVARALGDAGSPADADAQLAEALAFTLVGAPLAVALGEWTRRSLRANPVEAHSPLYAGYVTLAALTGAFFAVLAIQGVVSSALLGDGLDGLGVGGVLAWGALWAVHWEAARRTLPAPSRTPHVLIGSLMGLAFAATGLALSLGAAVDLLIQAPDVLGGRSLLTDGVGLLVGGALVWVRYWLTTGVREPRGVGWLALVLVGGVGGGLVMALVAASRLLWRTLVWFAGDPFAADAASHFDGAGTEVALLLTGILVWWYHRSVIGVLAGPRSEVSRVYEYLVAGLALGAAAAGVGTLLVAVIEAVTPGVDVGLSVLNTLLAAVTLLVVGVPVWWLFWGRIRRATAADTPAEVTSPTRRIYLVLLFGVAGVAAVIALVTVAITFFTDLVGAQLSLVTLRSARYGLGVLVAAAAVSAYHGAVFRSDREVVRTAPAAEVSAPRSIVLIGDADARLAAGLARATGVRVEVWPQHDAPAPGWDLDALVDAAGRHAGEDLLVIDEAGGPRVLVVDRPDHARPHR